MNILDKICRSKRLEIAWQKEAIPLSELKEAVIPRLTRDPLKETLPITRGLRVKPAMTSILKKVSFKEALIRSDSGIIAEFKRKSPSKGWIHPEADVASIVQSYEAAGAAAISCLTDEPFFGGNFEDFKKAREAISRIPLLRKDFILDEYQLYQSKAIGADVILLIAACLTAEEIVRFTSIAHNLDMEVLLEIHDESELSSVCPDADVIGINNRNLDTFVTDLRHSLDLVSRIPNNFVKISESGLSNPETVIKLRQAGFRGFLMGENFMKTSDPGGTLREFINQLN
ncbi:MAG: indole-3-glycerol phosphate synthase TrpC [Paludibacter sp.]|nr:indole-3-glycerol phosphate synthase TrpC [Paludibacter sp.]